MKKTILIAAVMFFSLSVAAFAQVTFSVGSIPVTAVANSGQTEKTGDITLTPIGGTPAAGTLSISYGVPITGPLTGLNGIQFTGALAGFFSVNAGASNIGSGLLVLNVAGGAWPAGSVTISGVRVATAGSTLTSLSASLSATGNAIVAGQSNVVVINSITNGLSGIAVPSAFLPAPAKINAVVPVSTSATINVGEGFLGAFGVAAAADPTQTHSTMVRITLDGKPPAGVSLTFPAFANTTDAFGATVVANAFETATNDGDFDGATVVISSLSDTADLDIYYRVATSTSITALENLTIPVTVTVSPTAKIPLPNTTIMVTATLAPIGPAFDPRFPFAPTTLAEPIPRYAEKLVGPTTLLQILPASTTLLIPFATTDTGFDTGIGIVNTTTDPGTAGMGFKGAVKQSGPITFYFYPQSGATIAPYTTATLASGGTYAILLSQLLEAAGADPLFTGYIVAVCSFTNAHGQYFVTDFAAFANGAQALVIPGDRTVTPESIGQ
jgi:hypothetical protein